MPTQFLRSQVAVVTGGGSGLGFAFAQHLGAAGATVVIGALPDSGVDEAVTRLRAEGVDAHGVELDVGDLGAVEALRDVATRLGELGVWVNNAGASGVYGPMHQVPPEVFERVLAANVRGVFHGTRTALGVLVPQGRGHVVNVWGKGSTKEVPHQSMYAASKAWNRNFTRAVRAEVKGSGVRVHGFDPGLVLTGMLSHVTVTPGMEGRVRALPYVAGLWGQEPADAAAPILDLLQGSRDDHRDLTLPTIVGRGLTSVASGRLRRSRRMPMRVTTLDP